MRRALAWVVVALLLAAGGGAGLAGWRIYSFRESAWGDAAEKFVEVPAGATAHQVVRLLARSGILSDERVAWAYVRWVKRDTRPMKAGEYSFQGPLRPDQVLEKIYRGDVKTYRFTVAEGLRMEEIAEVIERSGLGKASELLPLMNDPLLAREMGVPFSTFEGYLFPDTYTFARGPKPQAVLAAMVARFKEAYRQADSQRLAGVKLGEGEAATLASIVEKETGRPEERPRISCVFHNRLKRGIRLQTDPTVLYAKALRTGAWSQSITRADLVTPHPYNTYTVAGLPPGPIASAGSAALAAALHPSECADLYFVSRNDGTHEFCADLRCHAAAVRKWQVDYFHERRAEASRADPRTLSRPPKGAKKKKRHRRG
jgi:UPF0755 protein